MPINKYIEPNKKLKNRAIMKSTSLLRLFTIQYAAHKKALRKANNKPGKGKLLPDIVPEPKEMRVTPAREKNIPIYLVLGIAVRVKIDNNTNNTIGHE